MCNASDWTVDNCPVVGMNPVLQAGIVISGTTALVFVFWLISKVQGRMSNKHNLAYSRVPAHKKSLMADQIALTDKNIDVEVEL